MAKKKKKKKLKTKIKDLHKYKNIKKLNQKYLDDNFDLIVKNSEENLPYIKKLPTIGNLYKKKKLFEGKTCALCAPGPSLAYEMDNLKKFRDETVVIALDSAVYPLKLIGVFPDIIFVKNIDEKTVHLLDKYPTEKSIFVLPVSANPELIKMIKGEIYFYLPYENFENMEKWVKKFPKIPRILLKPSGAVMAYLFSTKLNFKDIVLHGYDFAFTDNKFYCDLVRYFSCKEYIEEYIKCDTPLTNVVNINDIFHEETRTNFVFHMSSEDFFRLVVYGKYSEITYNSSGGILHNINWINLEFVRNEEFQNAKDMSKLNIMLGKDKIQQQTNALTSNYMMPIMSRNILYNFKTKVVDGKFNDLLDRKEEFEEKTIIVTGAAASLDDSLEAIKKYRDKFYILTVDAALNPLIQAGITPEYCMTLDPQGKNAVFFEDVDSSKTSLIASITSHPKTLSNWKGDILFSWSITMSQHLMRLIQMFPTLPTLLPFGNVGSTSIVLALSLKFKNIIFTGIDFAYTHDRYYCRNVKNMLNDVKSRDELLDIMINKSNKKVYKTKDVRGNEVLTDGQMTTYIHMITKYLKSTGQTDNLYNGGAGLIDCVKTIDMEDFLSKL